MLKKVTLNLMVILILASCASVPEDSDPSEVLLRQSEEALTRAEFLTVSAADGVPLSIAAFEAEKPRAVVVFLPQIGSHSRSGYPLMAREWADIYGLTVYLADPRGQGFSGGERGDAPSVDRLYEDLADLSDWARRRHPGIPLLLGGHSSSCGLILNAASFQSGVDADGFLFLAPYFGFRSGTQYDGAEVFHVDMEVLVPYSLSSGAEGAHSAVAEVDSVDSADTHAVRTVSNILFTAVTAEMPEEQLTALNAPVLLLAGSEDRFLDPEKVLSLPLPSDNTAAAVSGRYLLEDSDHQSILYRSGVFIARFLDNAGF